jgi:hypothetical protein
MIVNEITQKKQQNCVKKILKFQIEKSKSPLEFCSKVSTFTLVMCSTSAASSTWITTEKKSRDN